MGVRSLGPVWSRPNAFGHGVPFRCPSSPDTGPGLTDLGKGLIRACNRLNILIVVMNDGAYGAEIHKLRHEWILSNRLGVTPSFASELLQIPSSQEPPHGYSWPSGPRTTRPAARIQTTFPSTGRR